MARTAISVQVAPAYQAGKLLSQSNGDAANDHEISLATAPKLHLLVYNFNAGAVVVSIEYPAGVSGYGETISKSVTIPGAGASSVIVLDIPQDLAQSGNLVHIDYTSGTFSDVRLMAFTWQDTPRND